MLVSVETRKSIRIGCEARKNINMIGCVEHSPTTLISTEKGVVVVL